MIPSPRLFALATLLAPVILFLVVHTAQFEPVPRERRREKIGRLLYSLQSMPRCEQNCPSSDMITEWASTGATSSISTHCRS